jgi:lipoprotein-releasing system permease protein
LNVEYFIARRYLFSKKRLNFITIISTISIIGVTIGTAAMIIVLSVFNGFNSKVTSLLVAFDPHIRIESNSSVQLSNYQGLYEKIKDHDIKASSPFTLNKGLLATDDITKAVYIKGIDEEKYGEVSGLEQSTVLGELNLKNKGDIGGIVLGRTLAGELRSLEGDTVTMISTVGLEKSLTQFVEPVTKKFVVRGIFESDNKEYDNKYAFISLPNSQQLFDLGENVNGMDIRLNDIKESEDVKKELEATLGNEYSISTWYDLHEDFYSLMNIERWVSFSILSLIIVVASFNILTSLTMTVIEKKRDIGVLKAIGATDKMIRRIFLYEGITVGLIGMIVGSALGLLTVLGQLEFKFYTLDPMRYAVDALPVELRFADFITVPLAAFLLCFLASIYPAYKAAKSDPIQSIRWE